MVTTIAASALGALLGVLEWRRIGRRDPSVTVATALKVAPHLIAAAPVMLILLAVQVAVVIMPQLTWNAPVWLEFNYTGIVFGLLALCLSFVFGLTTYGAFGNNRKEGVAGLASSVIVLGAILFVQWDFTTPLWPQLGDQRSGDMVLQTTGASCAAASAANLARVYGITRSEKEMAVLLGTTRYGSSPAQVVVGLHELGLNCEKAFLPGRLDAVGAPAILFYPPGKHAVGHAVVLAGLAPGSATVQDPLSGESVVPRERVLAYWKGHAVRCDLP